MSSLGHSLGQSLHAQQVFAEIGVEPSVDRGGEFGKTALEAVKTCEHAVRARQPIKAGKEYEAAKVVEAPPPQSTITREVAIETWEVTADNLSVVEKSPSCAATG